MIVGILFYLVILGIRDYMERKVPLIWLLTGFCLTMGFGIYRCLQGELLWIEMLLGTIPGILLLMMARLTGKAGYADGLVLIQLGLCLGYRESLLIFCGGLMLLSMLSVVLLFFRKVRKDTKMPYLSFLAIAFLLRQL